MHEKQVLITNEIKAKCFYKIDCKYTNKLIFMN